MDMVSYRVKRPSKRTSPVVFSSPHSGKLYPRAFRDMSILDDLALRSSEDAHVDSLFEAAPDNGAVLLSAVYPRAWVDVNRRKDELDPALIEGITRRGLNPRVASGLGVIPRVVSNGRCIYRGKISLEDAEERLENVWVPYHQMLQTLLDETRSMFGFSLLVDCHSMPREALAMVRSRRGKKPNIVIGDRYGASAPESVVATVIASLQRQGFEVSRNVPFAGAFITEYYGRPSMRQHALQIEIDRSLYMDERTLEPNDGFSDVKTALTRAIEEISAIGRDDVPLAAE